MRGRLVRSLHRADVGRSGVLEHLARLATLVEADRAATVWVDEYGPGLVHPYVVLDLLSDRPRRAFSAEPLRRAWDSGVPGILEVPGSQGRSDASAWTLAVPLGSDGTRSWFVVADSVTPRPPLSRAARDELMFLAGECSGVVLHRDLDVLAAGGGDARPSRPRFAGWPILQDIEGRQPDEAESRCISKRFVVARLPRLLVEEDLAIPLDRLRQQAQRAREEVCPEGEEAETGPEALHWEAVLDAFQEGDLERLGAELIALGDKVEKQNHLHGAGEIYRTAYEIFAATGQVQEAVDAARFAGRVLRRQARWEDAEQWYGMAREVAQTASMDDQVALALGGWATALQEKGNLPAARALLDEAVPYAERSGNSFALGYTFHSLLALEQARGNATEALAWGWRAVVTYEELNDRVQALASLSGALIDANALDAAENGWACVYHLSADDYYGLYAADALGHIAALKGNAAGFALWSGRADAMGWEAGPRHAKAEILLYRGLSFRALGHMERAEEYLRRAVAFAEENKFSQTLFAAEGALQALDESSTPAPTLAPEELETGLREMRLDLVGAGVAAEGSASEWTA